VAFNHFHASLDLGPESGRGLLLQFDGANLTLNEIGHFSTAVTVSKTNEEGGPGVDAADAVFISPLDVPDTIRSAWSLSGQQPPESFAKLSRCYFAVL